MTRGSARGTIVVLAAAAFVAATALAAVLAGSTPVGPGAPREKVGIHPGTAVKLAEFQRGLDSGEWIVTSKGDFEESIVDSADGRLRLRAATRGTQSETVKSHGVRSRQEFPLREGTVFSVDLDWNEQANGTFLSAGLVLAPAATLGDPCDSADFLRVEYIGVPPGKNARMAIVARMAGREHYLYREGWPEMNREGRTIGLQRLEIVIGTAGSFSILENDRTLFQSKEGALAFGAAYLYLQMTSRDNYPPREVFFSNAQVEVGGTR